MEIRSNLNGDELKVELSGEINALTAPELSTFLAPHIEKIKSLVLISRNVTLFHQRESACCCLLSRR